MKYLIALALGCSLVGCSKSAPTDPAPALGTATVVAEIPVVDSCASNEQIAVDFLNLYVRHLNLNESAESSTDTYEWLKKNSLVDLSVASSFATFDLVDGDPILNAQDYPDKFESAGCPTPGIVKVRGVEDRDFNVLVKVAQADGVAKVVGVGSINMRQEGAPEARGAKTANSKGASSGVAGTDSECVAGRDGAPNLGSPHGRGKYLCREIIDGPYWNDWYALVAEGGPSTYRVIADGKLPFEGLLTISCSGETPTWAAVEGFEDQDPITSVPAAAVGNVLQIACRS